MAAAGAACGSSSGGCRRLRTLCRRCALSASARGDIVLSVRSLPVPLILCGWCRRPSWRCRCSSGRSPAEILRPLSVLARSLLLLSPWRVLRLASDTCAVVAAASARSPLLVVSLRGCRRFASAGAVWRSGCGWYDVPPVPLPWLVWRCLSRNGGGASAFARP